MVLRHGIGHGLLLYSRRQNRGRFGDWQLIAPPPVIDREQRDDLPNRLEASLGAATGELLRHGVAHERAD